MAKPFVTIVKNAYLVRINPKKMNFSVKKNLTVYRWNFIFDKILIKITLVNFLRPFQKFGLF